MTDRTTDRERKQKQNYERIFGADDVSRASLFGASSAYVPCPPEETLANQNFKIKDNSEQNYTACSPEKEKPCFFGISDQCVSDKGLVVGGFCDQHNRVVFNRRFVNMAVDQTTMQLVPIPETPKLKTPIYRLLSLSNDVDVSDTNALFKHAIGQDLTIISKFLSVLSRKSSNVPSDIRTQVNLFCNTFFNSYSDIVRSHHNLLKNIYVTIQFKPDVFAEKYKVNRWLWEIVSHADEKNVDVKKNLVDNVVSVTIPLIEFLLPDILVLMGFHIDRAHMVSHSNEVVGSYSPNVGIFNDKIIMGIGYGVNATIQDTTSIKAINPNMDSNLQKIVNTYTKHYNMDMLVLDAVGLINADIPLIVGPRSKTKYTITDLNRFS